MNVSQSLNMGYDMERFITPVNDGLLCCICRDVLEDPVQTSTCEHAFCQTCISGWLVHENCCPEDRQPLYASQLRPIFRYMKNDLDKLRIKCRNHSAGCVHICNLEFVKKHENECNYDTVQCPSIGCTIMLERRKVDDHLQTCDYRTRECPKGCGLQILSTEDAVHNCIAELRVSLELLRSEMICKVDDQKQEMDLRLDAQRRHMVQRESVLRSQIDDLKSQLVRQQQDIKLLLETERQRRLEMERMDLEKRELLDLLRQAHKEQADGTKKHICRSCKKAEKVTLL